jgi:hypothetical protein
MKAEWMFGGRAFLVRAGGGREANERDCKKSGNMLFEKKDGKEDAAMKRSRDPDQKIGFCESQGKHQNEMPSKDVSQSGQKDESKGNHQAIESSKV